MRQCSSQLVNFSSLCDVLNFAQVTTVAMHGGPVCALPSGGDGGGPPGGGDPEQIAKMLQRAGTIGAVDLGHGTQSRRRKVRGPDDWPAERAANDTGLYGQVAAEDTAGRQGVAFPPVGCANAEVIEEIHTGGRWPDNWTDTGRTPF